MLQYKEFAISGPGSALQLLRSWLPEIGDLNEQQSV